MKKITLLFVLFCGIAFGQVNLTGGATYKLTIVGQMQRGNDGCGDIDGLNKVRISKQTGPDIVVFNGRKIYQPVDHDLNYTKSNPATFVNFDKTIRWKTTISCDGGPEQRNNMISINSGCYSFYLADAGDGLRVLSVVSRPVVKINPSPIPLYLDEAENLKIVLPDNISSDLYRWKYKVGNGPEKFFPIAYNGSSVLDIIGSAFLTPADYGKDVSVWMNMNCNAGTELAKGIANRNAFYSVMNCMNDCGFPFGPCITNCASNYNTYFNQFYTPQLIAEHQSINSNAITFTYLKSAPKIVVKETIKTSCYQGDDGIAKIKFNRQLLSPDETMDIVLKRETFPNVFVQAIPPIVDPVFDADNNLVLTNLQPGNYQLTIRGFYNGVSTYSPHTELLSPYNFTITQPDYVDFSVDREDVWCFNGANGKIFINATGGSGSYLYSWDDGANWVSFNDGANHTISNLDPATYTIIVKDSKDCYSKTHQTINGIEVLSVDNKEISKTVGQPSSAVSVNYTSLEPTFFCATNGRIVANVIGGTRFADNSYEFEWKNSSNIVQNATGSFDGSTYVIILDNIPSDDYTLTVKDANYDLSLPASQAVTTYNAGCTVSNSAYSLPQPAPIVVVFEEIKPISCNDGNQFFNGTDMDGNGQIDEIQDGILVAHVTGGVQLTNQNFGKPYFYNWKKQDTNGNWVALNVNDSIIKNLSHAKYALNVTDKNQIVLGTYNVNNLLDVAKDSTYVMIQPSKLNMNFTSSAPTCNPGSNGWAKANVSGGTPPYTYSWGNGGTTQTISNLNANPYFVSVKDARGCTIQGTIVIATPNGLAASETIINPTCFNGNDGSIALIPTGGTPFLTGSAYTYLWNTGATTQNISGLIEGDYWVTLTDRAGCNFTKQFTLVNPELTPIELGNDTTLCNGQSLQLNIAIPDAGATYNWSSTNGFSSAAANVNLTAAGTYTAVITNGVGCQVQDQVTVTTKNLVIDSEFLVTSQAYVNEEIVIVNTSNPFGENTEWTIPSTATIIEQSNNKVVIKFGTVGVQTISLKQTQEDCIAYYHKNINIEERSTLPDPGVTDNPFITEFNVFPNPNNGNFEVVVKIQEISPIKLRLFPYNGQAALIQKSESGTKEYNVNFNVILPSGTYVLVLETAKQTMVKKVIIL